MLTVLFIDVQGYTSRTARQTRQENELFVKEMKLFIEKHCKDKGGTFVKAMGDGFLLTFESPTDAVACGRDMQIEVEQRNAHILNEDNLIRFRIGISSGEVNIDDAGDVYGNAVNIAARIQKFAEPNGVYISESTYLAMNKCEIKALDLGPQRFKNVVREVRVYKVLKDLSGESAQVTRKGPKPNKVALIIGATLVIVIILSMFVLFKRKTKPTTTVLPEKPVSEPSEAVSLLGESLPMPRESTYVDEYEDDEKLRKALGVFQDR